MADSVTRSYVFVAHFPADSQPSPLIPADSSFAVAGYSIWEQDELVPGPEPGASPRNVSIAGSPLFFVSASGPADAAPKAAALAYYDELRGVGTLGG